MRRLLGLALLAALLSTGCATFTTLGSARTIDEGTSQLFVAPEMGRVKRNGKPLWSPQLELGARYGLTESVELGLRLWLPNASLDAKVQLLRSPSEHEGLDLALDPSFGYLGGFSGTATGEGDTLHVLTFGLPLLAGWNVGGGHQVVGSVKVIDQVWTGTGDATMTANLLFLGGSLGFVWRVTDGFRISPELGAGFPLAQTLSGFGTEVGFDGLSGQVGVAFLFGGDAPPPPAPVCR